MRIDEGVLTKPAAAALRTRLAVSNFEQSFACYTRFIGGKDHDWQFLRLRGP